MQRAIRVARYLKSLLVFYVKHGGQKLSKEKVEERYKICEACEHFNGIRCSKCGCCVNTQETHFNKLIFPNEECPDGRWETDNDGT